MWLRMFLILTTTFHLNCAQDSVYFPQEIEDSQHIESGPLVPPNINLTEIRGTNVYEKYVERVITGGITKLTLAVNKVLLQGTSTGSHNIVFAPISIAGALALIHLGSNGKTYEEISNILGLASGLDIQSKSVQVHEQFGRMVLKLEATSGFDLTQQVSFATGIFVQKNYPIRDLYKEAARQLYESDIVHVDFESEPEGAQNIVNNWVSRKTKGKIQNILSESPTALTKVIIASALYFKASWQNPFFEGATQRRPFYSNGRHQPSTSYADMMANGGQFPYFKDLSLECEIMGFPYKGNASVMYIVMPFNSDTEKLKQLERTLTARQLEDLADNTKYTRAVVLFPKMKMESTIDLKGPLKALGLKSLFDPSKANLALLSPGEYNPQIPKKDPTTIRSSSFTDSLLKRAPAASSHAFSSSPVVSVTVSPIQNAIRSTQSTPEFAPVNKNNETVLIFSRMNPFGSQPVNTPYEKYASGVDVFSRINTAHPESLDKLRQSINQQSTDNSYQNPGLFADKIIHKVYMDITETGTEAAASTSVSLSRDGSRLTFRVDVPFLFFIRNEEFKTLLFWGSVNAPTPHF